MPTIRIVGHATAFTKNHFRRSGPSQSGMDSNSNRTLDIELGLLPAILLRIANPVEPLDFQLVQNDLLPPELDGLRNGLGKQAGLFNQLTQRQENELD
jgi:hypothetical protein